MLCFFIVLNNKKRLDKLHEFCTVIATFLLTLINVSMVRCIFFWRTKKYITPINITRKSYLWATSNQSFFVLFMDWGVLDIRNVLHCESCKKHEFHYRKLSIVRSRFPPNLVCNCRFWRQASSWYSHSHLTALFERYIRLYLQYIPSILSLFQSSP